MGWLGSMDISRLLKIIGLFCKRALSRIQLLCIDLLCIELLCIKVVVSGCGVATISRLLKIIGLFCRISTLL